MEKGLVGVGECGMERWGGGVGEWGKAKVGVLGTTWALPLPNSDVGAVVWGALGWVGGGLVALVGWLVVLARGVVVGGGAAEDVVVVGEARG